MRPNPQRGIARDIVFRLQSAGFGAFWVGGCVRDFLLGREPEDFDIATDAKPGDVEELFPRTIPVGKKFGVMIVLEHGHQFQVATFRAEADYRDGRRPGKVVYANAEADASRRDFTVNGLFYDPIGKRIHDWVGGEKDLGARVIRTIGVPEERFGEDHLRLLRAVRFAARLGFEIEKKTFAAIQLLAPKIKLISAERIRDELLKLFAPPPESPVLISGSGMTPAERGLVLLHQSGLLAQVLPELEATMACEQTPDFHPEGSVFNHLCLMLRKLPSQAHESLSWAVLLHDIAKPVTAERVGEKIHFYGHEKIGATMAEDILTKLRFPKKQITEIVECVRHHMQFKDVKQMRKSTVRRMLMRETFPLELELHRLDCLGSNGDLEHYQYMLDQAAELETQPTVRPPLLTGNDLIALGFQPGQALGALLAELREKQLSDELTTPEAAKAWVLSNNKAKGAS